MLKVYMLIILLLLLFQAYTVAEEFIVDREKDIDILCEELNICVTKQNND